MAKPYIWNGKNEAGESLKGEGYHEEDCRLRAESQGCVSFTCEENPEYTDEDQVQSLTPEVANQVASDKIAPHTSDMQHLAEANARMFEQLNTLKTELTDLTTKLAQSEDARASLHAHLGLLDDQKTSLENELSKLVEEKSLILRRRSDLVAFVLAWNSEQIAKQGEGHVEPDFVVLAREIGESDH